MNPPPSEQSGEIRRKEKTRWRLAATLSGIPVGDAEARKEAMKGAFGRVGAERCNTSLSPLIFSHPVMGGNLKVGRRGGVPGR